MTDLAFTVFMAILQAVAAGALFANHPTAPFISRFLMFCFACGVAYSSVYLLIGCVDGHPDHFPTRSVPATIFLTLYAVANLYSTLRQWLPAKVWHRIRQLLALASCGHLRDIEARRGVDNGALRDGVSPDRTPAVAVPNALLQLKLAGFSVAGPHEGPEAFE
jgi:hypothetical protein